MDNSSRGSNISLTESELSLRPQNLSSCSCSGISASKNTKIQTPGGTIYIHKYNTRLSAKYSAPANNPVLKTLYVDLSNSRVEVPKEDLHLVVDPWRLRGGRRDSCSSEDSKEFDVRSCLAPNPLQLERIIMDPCVNIRTRNEQSWLKYFVLLSVTAILYLYLEVMYNADTIRRLNKNLGHIHHGLDNARIKIYALDNKITKLKDAQDMLRVNLTKFVENEIEKFSSDKTGKTDFALESIGGRIVQLSAGTENFEPGVSLFGMMLCDGKHGPRAMIQAEMSPGHCWAIKGRTGGVVIKLLGSVKVNAVSLEHISKSLSPTGDVSSAPKNFSGLRGLADRGHLLGEFTYNTNGSLVQTFAVENSNYYDFVEFKVLTNQGNPDFTCIYRFRVHGKLEKSTGNG